MEPKGIEPSTSALRTQKVVGPSIENKGLAPHAAAACTTACTEERENAHGGDFAEAMLMLMRLPLSDAERAEAVRRLLASRTEAAGEKGER